MPTLLVLLLTMLSPTPPACCADGDASVPPAVLSFATYSDSLATFYGSRDVTAMKRLYQDAATVEQRLLARYRLFPITQDGTYLDDLPDADEAESARELALLSALWAYRVANAPPWKVPTYGRRSEALLDRAKALDDDDPYVLLVDGQALLYKPSIFGGDVNAALVRFRHLRRVLPQHPHTGIPRVEADVWAWYAMHKLGHDAADGLREQLLAEQPPVLFRQFLTDPP
ncbi:MAG: hypothetical protein AAFP18_12115 [Bacteroidota bacterium]